MIVHMFLCLHYIMFLAERNSFFQVFHFSYKVSSNCPIRSVKEADNPKKKRAKKPLRVKTNGKRLFRGCYANNSKGYLPSSVSFFSMEAVVARSSL